MDISSSCNASAAAAATVKTPEADTETPTTARIYPAKPLSYSSNGVLKRLKNPHHHHRGHALDTHHAVVVNYRECLKNHAAALGGHAVDGCGEFMPSPAANPADPTSLKCAACGCHRNFHRRELPEEDLSPPDVIPALEYQPYHRHHPPPPQAHHGSGSHSSPPSSPSPPPISSSYYPSAPHVLLALSTGISGAQTDNTTPTSAAAVDPTASNSNGRKRFRTKFTQDQKERMSEFAERVGWKIQKRDEDLINKFCSEIGVERVVFKVWMHNNKNISGKKDHVTAAGAANYNDNGHGMDFNLLSTKSHNLDSTGSAAVACQFDLKNENNSHGVSAHVAAANGCYYSS